jgi:catechol 2,3-dioxygenase-like lactoylglutathione lyase family enzyme
MSETHQTRVSALDHVNIHTTDLAASTRFYADLLGLEPRDPPMALSGIQACWLYDGAGDPIIHLNNREVVPGPTGPIDHVALRCTGKAALLERLKTQDVEFNVFELEAAGRTLIFVRDPHGVMLELNFRGE